MTQTTYLHACRQCLGGGGTLCCVHFRDKRIKTLAAHHRLSFAHITGDLSVLEDLFCKPFVKF
jgi:hypothetical protein